MFGFSQKKIEEILREKEESTIIRLIKKIYDVGILLSKYKKEIKLYIETPKKLRNYLNGVYYYTSEYDVREKEGLKKIIESIQNAIHAIKESKGYDKEVIKESEVILDKLVRSREKGKILKQEVKIFEATKITKNRLVSVQQILEIIEEKLLLCKRNGDKEHHIFDKLYKKYFEPGRYAPNYIIDIVLQDPEYIKMVSKSSNEIRAIIITVLEYIGNAIKKLSEIYSLLASLLKIEEQIKTIK